MEDFAHDISSLAGEERQLNSHTVDPVHGKTIHVPSQVLLFYASAPRTHTHSTQPACLLRTERFNGQSLFQTSQGTDFTEFQRSEVKVKRQELRKDENQSDIPQHRRAQTIPAAEVGISKYTSECWTCVGGGGGGVGAGG